MHELSIAIGIVELAEEEMERRAGVQIIAVHRKLGALSPRRPRASRSPLSDSNLYRHFLNCFHA
jgi:Zn finger protein HypA/HybF involved in hydrogenase expression